LSGRGKSPGFLGKALGRATQFKRYIPIEVVMRTFHRHRSLVVPLSSTILSLLWLIFDPSFEPAITLIASVAASIVVYSQIKNDWTPRTTNLVYTIQIRSPHPHEIDSCVNAIL